MFKKREKQKNNYGTFGLVKGRFSRVKKTISLAVLAVVFVAGISAIAYRQFRKPRPAPVAQTKTVSDEIPGWWYQQYFNSSVCEREICKSHSDPDVDGLTNAQEYYYHSDPLEPHTIGDQLTDGELVARGIDPSRSGKMTFEQASDLDNILGESLLLEQDLKDIASESMDISKVSLPLVSETDLKVNYGVSKSVFDDYLIELNNMVGKYFPGSDAENISEILKSSGGRDVDGIKTKAAMLAIELKSITVPSRALQYHKYIIAVFDLLSKVLLSEDQTLDLATSESDQWFDDAQAFFAAGQKLNLEQQRLDQFMKQLN